MWLYLIIVFLSFVLTFIIRKIAIKKSVMDIPNERSSHVVPTPRGGGLAIVLVWYASLLFLYFTKAIELNLFLAQLCGLFLVIVSLADDVFGVNYKIRLSAQFLATGSALYFLGGLHKIDLGFYCFENTFLCTSIAVIAIVWFINLYNFIDGIDGYAAMEAIFVASAITILFNDTIILCLAFASLGFMFWNWQKAKIFMGDVGSTFLGFTIATFAIWYQNTNKASLFLWLILTSVFWFDATFTLFRRFRNKEQLSKAHKKHAYQRIVQAGFSHQKTVLSAILINLCLFLFAYLGLMQPKFLLVLFILTLLLLFFVVKQIDKRKEF